MELIVVIIIIVVMMGLLIDRVPYYQEQAEKTAMEKVWWARYKVHWSCNTGRY